MVAGSNLCWQGIKRKAVYTEGAGLVCKYTGQCSLEGSVQGGGYNYGKLDQVHKFPHMGKFMHLIRFF